MMQSTAGQTSPSQQNGSHFSGPSPPEGQQRDVVASQTLPPHTFAALVPVESLGLPAEEFDVVGSLAPLLGGSCTGPLFAALVGGSWQ